ncbi:uncharacterized protein LOC102290825 [Haplochromis burtoni]|uniref:uncharacterized protein LOC102290825 n=1 Tax=Haplochromis burtoni TaxID=8153 RepID=UPI001C2CEB92|nr:uncharacterized protein LOC102290825 [Haplochromis burtoni]
MWTSSDLDPKSVHQRREGGDDVRGQNQRYSRRTSMNRYAFIIKDFSLTLRKPTKTDSGNYTCSISAGGKERRLRDIQLQVKDQQAEVMVREGSESVILPCNTTPDLPEDTAVEWTRSDLGLITVHEYSNRNDDIMTQDEVYRDRTKMNEDLLRTGDLSLTLKKPTERDSGGYICTIYRDKDILRQKIVLQVKEQLSFWDAVLLFCLLVFLLIFLLPCVVLVLFHFMQYFMSDYEVKVDSGVESVQLPCKAIVRFLKDSKVEWKDRDDRKVHVYQNGSDPPGEQDQFYRGRTKMKRNLLKFGNFSLTLKHPTDGDTNTYTCTVSRRQGAKDPEWLILNKKKVELEVRVPKVEVDSGVESIQLPCKTTVRLPKNPKVEWKDSSNMKVHVHQNGPIQQEGQYHRYRDRTEMNEKWVKTRDLRYN